MKAEIEISNGQHIIDIIFNNFASCLVVKKVIAVNWPDCAGSIGEYYAVSGYAAEERSLYTYHINHALSTGSDDEQLESIRDFLQLFADGTYSVIKYSADSNTIEFVTSHPTAYYTYSQDQIPPSWLYPSEPEKTDYLFFSITNEKINNDRVEYYCELIRQGGKPTVLTFESFHMTSFGSSWKYVLDGHHKIRAYVRLGVPIPFINITKLEKNPNTTPALLAYARTILDEDSYMHLFENNDENLLIIDFIQDEILTDDLDRLLKTSGKIEVSLINVLRKYAGLSDDAARRWLEERLASLKKNPHVGIFGWGKGLRVYEIREDKIYAQYWNLTTLKTNYQLYQWIKNTIR